MRPAPDLATVNAALEERMMELTRELMGANPVIQTSQEWRFRRRGSLAVMVGGMKRGRWFDHEAGCGGDPLGLIAYLRQVPMREAYGWALRWIGAMPHINGCTQAVSASNAPQEHEIAADARKVWSLAKADEVWRQSVALEGTPAEVYLRSRALSLPADAPLRYHPMAWRNRSNGPPGPAMVARMTHPSTGESCGTHVTYLRKDGSAKASGQMSKVMFGRVGAVRVYANAEASGKLGLAEGIETGLAVMQRGGWTPVWAATSAGAIQRFPILPSIEALTVFADADPSGIGMDAARDCCRRWAAAGR